MKPYQSPLVQREICVQGIINASTEFLDGAIKYQIEQYRGDKRMALEAVLNRFKGAVPIDLTDSLMLKGFALVYEHELERMIRKAVLKYPPDYQETMRHILLYKEPKPPEKVHERGTPELQYRC